ncbi:MAG: threonylcarbamoyl-AMP synthase [PS1 clade bacterium]|uniref:Threonylcarbamoyl-AMP synthase n=1 Tax=PS1 clade bacterium TaxID=2175152 RepID=A0A368DYI3_9PROT|nr:MAG: threonylcarbamoyl-AMP synthase [PS1 clade bacterium]
MSVLPASAENIEKFADMISSGEVVAFPTETVYGLGVDAGNDEAVAKIFELKGRPQFNPLIVHVRDLAQAERLGVFSPLARSLAKAHWPDALTLVVPRSSDNPSHNEVSLLASAGLPSLALRVPAHPVAQELLAAVQCPLAAPSANKSGHLSPTQAAHVAKDFPNLPTLDGGVCSKGLESTIIGCLEDEPVLLRRGSLDAAALEETLGHKLSYLAEDDSQTAQLAPGRLARHYAPQAGLRLNAETVEQDEALLAFGKDAPSCENLCLNLSPLGNLIEAAANLFSHLHELDTTATRIAVMPIPNEGLGAAINDRLERAAAASK